MTMAKKVYLKDRGSKVVIPGVGEFNGEVSVERYDALIEKYPQLAEQFEVVEETTVKPAKEVATK